MTPTDLGNEYILINTFTALHGGIDALMDFQLSEMAALQAASQAHGWRGNEVYRALDGKSLVVVTRFASPLAQESWAGTSDFQRHVRDLEPFVDDVTSVPVALIATHGVPRRVH